MRFKDEHYPVGHPSELPAGFVSPREGIQWDTTEPERPGTPEYENQLSEALTVRASVAAGVWPGWFLTKYGLPFPTASHLPDWLYEIVRTQAANEETSEAEAAGELVKMDHPFDLARHVTKHAADQLGSWEDDGHYDFLSDKCGSVLYASQGAALGLNRVFDIKYFWGQPRPGEVIEERAGGPMRDSVQAYPHPGHPSWPAGHGGAAGGTARRVVDYFHLKPGDGVWENVVYGCAAFAMFRTFSLMHTANENIAGFLIGWDAAGE